MKFTKPTSLPSEIFRAYDIRGLVDEQLTPDLFYLLGKAYATEMHKLQLGNIAVGYDGRLSSPQLADGLIAGLTESGINVVLIGMVPTPCLYFAVADLKLAAGIMITGSHNPVNYNGCKMLMNGEAMALERITQLQQNILDQAFTTAATAGTRQQLDFLPRYVQCLTKGIQLTRPHKLVIDCGNGVTGACAAEIYRKLGCEVIEMYCEVDGTFPNHHPDPGNPKNLVDLQAKVAAVGASAGFAFDGDGDRLGLISDTSEIIYPDRIMMLLAQDLLSRHPGAPIIFDVKCSSLLAKFIKEQGGEPIMWNTGHSLVKKKMQETGALLAGEMSGHIFFAENWPRSDDALLAGVRLLQLLDQQATKLSEIFAAYPELISTPEINLQTEDHRKFEIIEKMREHHTEFAAAELIEIDGLRAEYADGWGLVRASNTSPVLVLRFEANTPAALNRILAKFIEIFTALAPELDLQPLHEHKQ